MKHFLHNYLRALCLSLAVLMFLPMLPQKPEFVARDYKLHELVVDKNNDIFAGELVAPNSMMCNITNSSVKASTATTTEDARAYEAMAGEWIMTTASGNKWTVIVHAASEGEPDYNRVLNITGMMGYPWTNLKMYYSYNHELGKPEIYVKAGTLFAGGVDFSGIGPCNVYLYNLVDGYLTTTDFAANISADRKIIDFGESTFTGALFKIPSGAYSGYVWFRETGVKMTQMYKIKQDGLYYNLDDGNNQATVVQNSEGKYSGDIIIPESVEHDGITYSVTSIGNYAFYECSGLTSVTIGNSVTSIGDYAFDNCSGLTSVTIGNSVTSIGSYAFRDCSGLTSVTIPNSVTSIGASAFSGCSGLTSVTIPNSVTSIGSSAFYGCSGLTSVTIPNSVTSIGASAFSRCSGLTSITVESENSVYDSRNNCNAIIETVTNTLLFGCKSTIIPNSVTSIGDAAFNGCFGLTSVAIPNSVTSIGHLAFLDCSGLTSVTIGNSVTSIGVSAFNGCCSLTSISIPNSVKSIWNYAFYNCSCLASVTIGNSVESIGEYALSGCSELLDVYCYAEKEPSAFDNAFDSTPMANATLHVPASSIHVYKANTPWSGFGKIVALTPEETGVDELKGENGHVKTSVYDLSGRRVQKAQKGIFIQNGKVMVK